MEMNTLDDNFHKVRALEMKMGAAERKYFREEILLGKLFEDRKTDQERRDYCLLYWHVHRKCWREATY